MRNIIEVPLKAADGILVGKVQIDKNGQLRIRMKKWMKPGDFAQVISLLLNLNADMTNHIYLRQTHGPARRRWGLF